MAGSFAPAAERNGGPILAALILEFSKCESVLEIGSGTGQHAVLFGRTLDHLTWQPSDVAGNCDSIGERVSAAALLNVREPLPIDVCVAGQHPGEFFDAVFSANTAHIMPLDAVHRMIELAGSVLTVGGVFVLYGPFRQNGRYNTDSNASFDRALRRRDPAMGIRDIELLDKLAVEQHLSRVRTYTMPANNHLAVWAKSGTIE